MIKVVNNKGELKQTSGGGGSFTCSSLSTCDTSNLPEGSNLYFTTGRAITALTGQDISLFVNDVGYLTSLSGAVLTSRTLTINGTTYDLSADRTWTLTTADVSESGNLYFTNARAIASTLTGYTSGAGVISSADSTLTAIQKLNGNTAALVTGVSSVSGTANRITVSPTTGATIVDIAATYVGQTSITTLGTVTTGTITLSSTITGFNIVATGLLRAASSSNIGWASSTQMNNTGVNGVMRVSDSTGTANTGTLLVGGLRLSYLEKTANYTTTAADHTINCTSGTFNITLLTPSATVAGQIFVVKNTGAGIITVVGTIDGATNYSLASTNKYVAVQATTTAYIIIGNN